MEITYKGKTVNTKIGMKEHLLYQTLTKSVWTAETLVDNFYMFYASLTIALNEKIELEDFVDFVTNNENIFVDWMNSVAEEMSNQKD